MKDKKLLGNQRSQQTPSYANQAHNGLPWKSLEQQVVRMQMQISQACQRGDKQAVHTLQQRLMESEAARLLAVRRVTEENQGKRLRAWFAWLGVCCERWFPSSCLSFI